LARLVGGCEDTCEFFCLLLLDSFWLVGPAAPSSSLWVGSFQLEMWCYCILSLCIKAYVHVGVLLVSFIPHSLRREICASHSRSLPLALPVSHTTTQPHKMRRYMVRLSFPFFHHPIYSALPRGRVPDLHDPHVSHLTSSNPPAPSPNPHLHPEILTHSTTRSPAHPSKCQAE
jgi:hypothetical protein